MKLNKFYKLIQYILPTGATINLDSSQWWSYKKLKSFQNKRLREMINYCYHYISGYRKKFDQADIKPEDVQTQEDLKKVPIIEKEELQNNPEFVNQKLVYMSQHTSGSTGVPLKYYESKKNYRVRLDSHLRGWAWNGYSPGKKLAVIASSQGQLLYHNTLNLVGDLNTKNLKKMVRELFKFQPEYLRGYVGSLYILARYCLENRIKITGIKAIIPISENLYDYQRKTIESIFNSSIFEEYCCNDGGACAWECNQHQGLHYFMERSIIESIKGEMIVTDLWNKAMPFIRYKNGDAVRFFDKTCPCGRQLPLIKVKGRVNDFLVTKKGIIHPTLFAHRAIGGVGPTDQSRLDFKTGIRAIQYIQKKNYIVDVNLVKNEWCTEKEISRFKLELKHLLKGMRKIKLNFVEDIPATGKGKRSFIINEDKKLLNKYDHH